MPLTAEHPRELELSGYKEAYVQHSPLSAPEGFAWERSIARAVIQFTLGAGTSALDSPIFFARVLVQGPSRAPFMTALSEPVTAATATISTWGGEAQAIFPNTRLMNADEVASYKEFRLRTARRV